MLSISIHEAALAELEEAAARYEQTAPGLGAGLLEEVEHAFDRIQRNPEAWPPYMAGTRQFILSRFPFAIIYRGQDSALEIVAIRHQRRHPEYWIHRL